MSVILDAAGNAIRKRTETTLSPRLVEMLTYLEDLLRQTGLTITCYKCRALGLPDIAVGENKEDGDVFRVTCSCAVRTYNKKTGHVKVFVN